MAEKIVLSTLVGSADISTINENFEKIEDALNEDVLYRDNPVGQSNEMSNNLDMNDNRILNLPLPSTGGEPVTKDMLNYTDTSINATTGILHESHSAITENLELFLDKNVRTVKSYGAKGDGVTDDSAAIQAAVDAEDYVLFNPGTYIIGTAITVARDNVTIDFGKAVITTSVNGHTFSCGVAGDTPTYTGLKILGGIFKQSDPTTSQNRVFIAIQGYSNFHVQDCAMYNVGNGGLYIGSGAEDGTIQGLYIKDKTNFSTIRGIFVDGSAASDYNASLIDTSTLLRNATPVPVYGIKRIQIRDCNITLAGYGIYLINTWESIISSCTIDISNSGNRCIAFNVNCSQGKVTSCVLRGNQASTGILASQYSLGIIINGNNFEGSFAGGRDVHVTFGSTAIISNNVFTTDSTQQIQQDMGGESTIIGNTFTRSAYSVNTRVLYANPIDPALAGTSNYGDTAGNMPGFVFANNMVSKRVVPVYVGSPTSAAGNIPSFERILVQGNLFIDFQFATGADEYGMRVYANGTTYQHRYAYFNNTVYPLANANRNTVSVSGSGVAESRTDIQQAVFRVTHVAGGSTTVAKRWGANFSLAATPSANSLILTPRTINNATGAGVAHVTAVTSADATVATYRMVTSGTNYTLDLYDAAGAQMLLSAVNATIDVQLTHIAS